MLAGTDKANRLRQAMEAELEASPGNPYASAKLGGLLISEGRHEEAIALLRRGLEQEGVQDAERYELLLHLGLAIAPSDPDEAIACYRQALEIPLDTRISLGARLNLAARLMEQGNLDEAINLTQTATQRAPEVALGWYNLGLMQRRRGDIGSALEAYRQALSLDPDNAECHQNDAVARLMGGDIEGARNGFRTAVRLLEEQAAARRPARCASCIRDRETGQSRCREQATQGCTVVVTRAAEQQEKPERWCRRCSGAGPAGPVIGPPDDWPSMTPWPTWRASTGSFSPAPTVCRRWISGCSGWVAACRDGRPAFDSPPWGARRHGCWRSWAQRLTSCHLSSWLTA